MAKIQSNTPIDIVINGTTVFTADSSGISITGSLNSTTPVTSASYAETASFINPLNQNLVINGNLIVSGSTTIGDATTDTITMTAATMSLSSGTGILNIDSNTFVVDGANNRVGIGKANPNSALDVNGNTIITGSLRTTTGLNIAGTATFTGDIVRSNFVAGGNNAFQATQFLAGLYDTNQQLYALSGSTQLSPPFVVRRSVNTAGSKGIVAGLETDGTSQGGINGSLWAFTAGNGTRQIVRAGLDIINLVNTAASESADLAFYTKPGSPANTAVIERMRITSTGTTIFSGSVTFAAPTSPAFNGEIVRFGAGTLTTGQLYFLSSSGTWSLADASTTGSSTGMLGIAVGSSPTTDGLLIRGFAASSSYTYGTGSVVYMATGSGIMTATSPSSSNHVVRVMGYQTTLANTIYFDPSKTWVTLA